MTDHCGDIQREHVDRIVNIEGRMARLEERVTTIESQTEYNTKGVNNFNSFRIDASGKLKFMENNLTYSNDCQQHDPENQPISIMSFHN